MHLDELTPEQRENLTTEDIIQLASTLACNERLMCSTPLTPMINLVVYLNDMSCAIQHSYAGLEVVNRDYMRDRLRFQLHPTNIQRARIRGRQITDPGIIKMEDVVNIFRLDATTRWQILGVQTVN